MSSIYDAIGQPGELSTAQKQWLAVEDLRQLIANNYAGLLEIYNKGFAVLNANRHGLTQRQVIGAMSQEDWTRLYLQSVIMKTLVNHVKPGTIVDFVDEIDMTQAPFLPNPFAAMLQAAMQGGDEPTT